MEEINRNEGIKPQIIRIGQIFIMKDGARWMLSGITPTGSAVMFDVVDSNGTKIDGGGAVMSTDLKASFFDLVKTVQEKV